MTALYESHIEENSLELYAMGRLPEEQTCSLEEHLLLCEDCQDRLAQFDEFLRAFRHVTQRSPEPELNPWHRFREAIGAVFSMRPMYAFGAVATAALALVILVPREQQTLGTYQVALESTRSASNPAVASVPPQHKLDLKLDLRGVPKKDRYQVTIADAEGETVFTASAEPQNQQLPVSTDKGLRAGQYWVRVSEPAAPHALLREYSLTVK
ncbi:MAG: hypothetical protein JST16_12995 [Bdellovibrionales bacterium]|nr:hypothetical protein [Bdellovibrionales bacterium]